MDAHKSDALKRIPAVDLILTQLEDMEEAASLPRPLLTEGVRRSISHLRMEILRAASFKDIPPISRDTLARSALQFAQQRMRGSFKRVINATGTVLHTNLGRSVLAKEALAAVMDTAGHYSNLEYDVEKGERGERYTHVEELLCRLTGAEGALVVNNNAAAVLLALDTLAKGREVLVSRGELVEIGGSFRIPSVMALSGARLVEVGTTNKTRLEDYKEGLTPETRLLMKVHTSNYRVVGFTEEVSLEAMVALGLEVNLPVLEDLGSGVLHDMTPYGFPDEPTVQARIKAGASIVTFSGDKLLGGPQAGVIVGKKDMIDRMKKNQLTRALRIDKMTLAALEATLLLYLQDTEVRHRVPILRMITTSRKELEARAISLAASLRAVLGDKGKVDVVEGSSPVGGGALPLTELATYLVSVSVADQSTSQIANKLRQMEPPLILRVKHDSLLLDPRTLLPGEEQLICRLFSSLF